MASSELLLPPLLLLLLLPPPAATELGAHYTKSPESVTAPLDDEVVFSCQTNIPADHIHWWHRALRPGAPWQELASPSSPRAFSKLSVLFRSEADAGEYRCVSWYGASALASVAARLTVARLGEAPLLADRHVSAPPGTSLLLRCPPPPSEPPPVMMYYRVEHGQKEPVSSSDGEEVGGVLLLQLKAGAAPATYTCAARNELSDQVHVYRHRITVLVKDGPPEPPTFTEDMVSEVTGVEGSAAVLGCAVVGRPAPRLTWRRKDSRERLPGAPQPALLHFKKLQASDEGEYVCEASNSAGRVERAVRLSVQRAPVMAETRGEDLTAVEGRALRVPCARASGSPAPALHWVVNGEDAELDPNIEVIGSDLHIKRVEKRYAGMLQCFATNSLGSTFTASLFRVIPLEHATIEGRTGQAEDWPTPFGRRHPRPKGRNKEMVPPTQPNVTRLSDESVMVRWAVLRNTGLPIQFFKVQYRDLQKGRGGGKAQALQWMTTTQDIPPHVRSYEVDGLEPDHVYRFRIAAVYSNNDNAQGPKSGRFTLLRGSGLPRAPPAPLDLRAEAVSPTDIHLHWQLPSPSSDKKEKVEAPEGFYVYYRPASSAGDYSKAAVEGGGARALMLRHLLPGALYELKLQSFTPVAASHFSPIITQRTLKAPVVDKVSEAGLGASPAASDPGGISSGQLYIIIGSVCASGVLAIAVAVAVICRKRRECSTAKQEPGPGAAVPPRDYSPSAPPGGAHQISVVTITANPLPPLPDPRLSPGSMADPSVRRSRENMEMSSYISAQNNNCPSQSGLVSAGSISSCRDELRKTSGGPTSQPARENYV